MEIWFVILVSISTIISLLLHLLKPAKSSRSLPPGVHSFSIITRIRWLWKLDDEFETSLRSLHARLGPIISLHLGIRPLIFVSNRTLAHEALIQNGAVWSDRPLHLGTERIISGNQHQIKSVPCGTTWRALRRNLTSEILSPTRVKSYAHARAWGLQVLVNKLLEEQGKAVRVVDHLHYAMFSLLTLMCFGDKLDEKKIKEVECVQKTVLVSYRRFRYLNIWPNVTRFLLRKRWQEFFALVKIREDVLLPLIRARAKLEEESKRKQIDNGAGNKDYVLSYVDTLLNLELPEEKRKLNEKEIVSLCSEFLVAGTDTTSTALEWIMANLVKYPRVQEKLFAEMREVFGGNKENSEIKEEDLHKLPYLKAVILEGLRKHPPGHFVLPHAVTEDTTLGGYKVPKNAVINFMVADIGRDPKVWEDPMEFKPERFMKGESVDITGNRGIKMMPFGVGRRICPGMGLAMLLLEYYVSNLVWRFEWKAVEGEEVDLASEKLEFTVVMTNTLKAHVLPRRGPSRS